MTLRSIKSINSVAGIKVNCLKYSLESSKYKVGIECNPRSLSIFHFSLFTAFFLLSFSQLFAQDSIHISGQFENNTRYAKVVVQKFGIGLFDIAAIDIDKETGKFSITAPPDLESGIYRFRYSQTASEYVDVIINTKEKEIHFTLDLLQEPKIRLPVFQKSVANQQWYQWQSYERDALLEIELLEQLLASWPNIKDSLYNFVETNRINRIAEFEKKRTGLLNNTEKDFWVAAMVRNKPRYFAKPRDDWRLQDFHRRNQYWQKVETSQPELVNTPLYIDHILTYVMYYMNPEMKFSEAEMIQGFKNSIDTIIIRFSANEITREFALRYLQLGFKEIGVEEVLQYIDEKHTTSTQCTDDDALKKRLAGYEALKPGNIAPEITLTGSDGKDKTLFDFKQEKILLVFWASWCPHCMEELPKLNAWAAEHSETLVLAVSLDDEYGSFQLAAKRFPNLLQYCDLQRWEGDIVKAYFIAATPTYFLLDQHRKIVAKSPDFDRIRSLF